MPKEIYVTPDGLKKLEKEFEVLKSEKRKEISQRIQEAKELGDLSENAEYASAKDEQAQVETRIIELKAMLKNIKVIESDQNNGDGVIRIGSKVVAKFSDLEVKYEIVGSNEADPANGRVSNESPIGSALLGSKKGDRVKVKTPEGEVEYEIMNVH